ncbi:MAG: EF-hand domain-containing protein [Gammaproteobacteria bacterium]
MKINRFLVAALIAASPAVLLAATPTTTAGSPAPGSDRGGHEGAWFNRLDTNKDGAVSKEEAQAAADERVTKMFAELDTNHDGQITQDEVRAAHEAKKAEMEAKFAARVKQADTNGDGLLSKEEVQAGLPMLARGFDRLDTNKDGQLSSDELQAGHRMMMARRGGGPRHWHGGPPADGSQPDPSQQAPAAR